MSQDMSNTGRPRACGGVESQAGHHRHHHPGANSGRSSTDLPPVARLGHRLMARYRVEGKQPSSPAHGDRGPHPRPCRPRWSTSSCDCVRNCPTPGLDAGADTIGWHLRPTTTAWSLPATISRHLTAPGWTSRARGSDPSPPTSGSKLRCPTTWQSDFTHYRLTRTPTADRRGRGDLSWLDDCSRYALHVTAHLSVTGPIVLATFRESRCPARDPGVHADRQRHGVHHPPGRRPRRPQRLRT